MASLIPAPRCMRAVLIVLLAAVLGVPLGYLFIRISGHFSSDPLTQA